LDWDCVRESECREYDFVDDGDDMFIVGYCVIRAILWYFTADYLGGGECGLLKAGSSRAELQDK
jgi:hypothetical protein